MLLSNRVNGPTDFSPADATLYRLAEDLSLVPDDPRKPVLSMTDYSDYFRAQKVGTEYPIPDARTRNPAPGDLPGYPRGGSRTGRGCRVPGWSPVRWCPEALLLQSAFRSTAQAPRRRGIATGRFRRPAAVARIFPSDAFLVLHLLRLGASLPENTEEMA